MHYPAVCADRTRRTCLALSGRGSTVEFIPLSIENGFNIEAMPSKTFEELFTQLDDYPVERCASLYAQYAMSVGASPEALEALGRLTKLSEKEIQMATAKKASTTEKAVKAVKTVVDKLTTKTEKPVKAAKTEKAVAEKPAKAKGPSASQMFKDLIMAGNLSDQKIFEKVQTAFGLDDKKFSYVAWYRKDLAKKGMNPPEAKAVKAGKAAK